MNRHYLNNRGFYKLAQSIKDYINRKITGYAKLGTASTKDFTTYVSPTQTEQLPISSSVYSAMTNMLRGAYHPTGSKTIAELTSDLLVRANLGNVYKITEDGVTSELFIGGAGQTIKTGDNAVVLYASEDTYMFSLESGVVDLDAYQKKELTRGALIEDVIPTNASASNQLVTKDGVVDRISTNNWISDDFDKAIPSDGASFKIFTVLNFASHTPATGGNYIVIAIAFQSALIQQEAIQNGTNNRYIRYLKNGSWSSWQKLVTESDILKERVHYSAITTIEKVKTALGETFPFVAKVTAYKDTYVVACLVRFTSTTGLTIIGYEYQSSGYQFAENGYGSIGMYQGNTIISDANLLFERI